jgi:outer membrane protein
MGLPVRKLAVFPLLALLLLGTTLPVPVVRAADLKLGYVDAARLLDEAPQARDATRKLKEEFAPREEAISRLQDEVKKMEDALARDGAVMSETERRDKGLEIMSKKRDLQRMQEDFREDVNIRRNDALSGLQDLIKDAIQEVGKAGGYDLIFFEGISFANPKLDVTDEVLKGLNKRYKAPTTKH